MEGFKPVARLIISKVESVCVSIAFLAPITSLCDIAEFQYRLFVDKQESSSNENIRTLIRRHLPNIVMQRESPSELIFGIRRIDSQHVGEVIRALDEHGTEVGVNSYGLSMTTIEEVFLR